MASRFLVLLALLAGALHCNARRVNSLKVTQRGLTYEQLSSSNATYCTGKELPSSQRYISALSVDAGETVASIRVYVVPSGGAIYGVLDHWSCVRLDKPPGQLIFLWHPGAPTRLLLARTGGGLSGFPVPESSSVVLEVTHNVPENAGPIRPVSVTLLLSSLRRPVTSGIATMYAEVQAAELSNTDHIIAACQFSQNSLLQPVKVFWDTTPEVYRVSVYIMDETKHNTRIARVIRQPDTSLQPTVLRPETEQIVPGSYMALKCHYNSTQGLARSARTVKCSAHILFETSSPSPEPIFCNHTFLGLSKEPAPMAAPVPTEPAASDLVNPLLSLSDNVEAAGGEHFEEVDWLKSSDGRVSGETEVGSISGVAVDPLSDHIVIVHTADKTKHKTLFDSDGMYLYTDDGPIASGAVVEINPTTGAVERSWGSNFFYLPHGVFVDHLGQTWVTDRAKHQVYGFRRNSDTPFLTLGEEFIPGTGDRQFCKPADVAVSSSSGTIFVADGHCNSRIMKFSSSGHLLANWAMAGEGQSSVFHSIALSPGDDLVCVALSSTAAIYCVDQFSGQLMKTLKSESMPVPTEGIAFGTKWGSDHPVLHAAGGGARHTPITGVTLDFSSGDVLDSFQPSLRAEVLSLAHDLAVSKDGMDIYLANLATGRLLKFSRRSSSGSPLGSANTTTGHSSSQGVVSTSLSISGSESTSDASDAASDSDGSSISSQSASTTSSHKTSGVTTSVKTTSHVRTESPAAAIDAMTTKSTTTHPRTEYVSTGRGGIIHDVTQDISDDVTNDITNDVTHGITNDIKASETLSHDKTSNTSLSHRGDGTTTPELSTSDDSQATESKTNSTSANRTSPDHGSSAVNHNTSHIPVKGTTRAVHLKAGTPGPTEETVKKTHKLTGAETIAIIIIGACVGIIVFAIVARLYISYQKRRKFHRRLFPEEYGNKSSRRVLLEAGTTRENGDEDEYEDSETGAETYGNQRAFRYYWKKVAKQVA